MYSILLLLTSVLSQNITLLTPNQPENQQIYYGNNQSYSFNFHIRNTLCCTPPILFTLNHTNQVQFSVDGEFVITSFSAKFDGSGASITSNFTNNLGGLNITCQSGNRGSGLIKNSLKLSNNQMYFFYYWYTCDSVKESSYNFDWSTIILITMACLAVYLIARHGNIRSFQIFVSKDRHWIAGCDKGGEEKFIQFQGVRVTPWFILIYVAGVISFYLVVVMVGESDSYFFFLALCSIVFLIFGTFFINEILCSLSANMRMKTIVFHKVRVCDILSVVFSIILLTGYLAGDINWISNDILAILLLGSQFKLLKLTSLKDGTIVFAFSSIYGVLHSGFLFYYGINYQQYVLQFANFPLLLEVPTIKDSINTTCSWLSIGDIVLPGIIIAYLNRYDLNKNSKVYTVIGLFGLAMGTILWIVSQIFASYKQISLPLGIFEFIFIIGGTYLWSVKQGDFNQIWHGHFYDTHLINPNAVRNSLQGQLLIETELDPSLFQGIKLVTDESL